MQIKLLSWNIWFDGYFDEAKKFLNACDADIIALQEIVAEDKSRNFIGYLTDKGYQHVFDPVVTIKKDGRVFGNAIFSKYPIIATRRIELSEVDCRNAIRADIQVADKILHVYSTHLLHSHQMPSETQELQALNLIKALPSEKVVVMGDFNATPESSAVLKMNSALVNTDPTNQPTWSVYPEGCPTCKPADLNIRLDYIFISRDIKLLAHKIEVSKASDHLPVSVEIEI